MIVGVAVVAVVALIGGVGLFALLHHDGPAEVAEDYLTAGFNADYETYCEMWTAESMEDELDGADVADCQAYAEQSTDDEDPDFMALLEDVDFDIAVGKVTEDEDDPDQVTVDWAIVWTYTGDDVEGAEELFDMDGRVGSHDGELDLVKEDGDWKVDADSL